MNSAPELDPVRGGVEKGGELNQKIPGPGLKKLPGGMWAN